MLEKSKDIAFYIHDIPIKKGLILAPIDGFTDSPFRRIIKGLGAVMMYTEFINAIDILNHKDDIDKKTNFHESERPIAIQIFDNDPERIIQAALLIDKNHPDFIDINLGCSTKRVAGRGAGAGLLQEPKKIATIFHRLSKQVTTPITTKMRLGWDSNSKNYIKIAKIIEDNGGAMIAVHARSKEDGFHGKAEWDAIAEIKSRISIPVIGNGDVKKVRDIDKMYNQTKCDGVMVGRAAIDNPWIFCLRYRDSISKFELKSLIQRHILSMIDFYGNQKALLLFRKYLNAYLKPYDLNREVRKELLSCSSHKALLEKLNNF
ncbi:MAG TPA: tRNA dihydrouridine synthase DusB [Anaerolineae bacterium]|nr:tRNA dihydrouridine synthase DusB [Anaerolineae bacterium]